MSHITLPSGNTYEIKDAYAREILAAGIQFVICYDGTATPVVANIPAGVTVTYNGTEYTGTMPASSAEPLHFYLVLAKNNVYAEYVSIKSGSSEPYTYSWELLGDTSLDLSSLGALAWKDTVSLSKGSGDQVLGESTSFTNAASQVSFESGAGSDFVTGYNNDGVAPSFSEGAFNAGSLPSFTEGAFSAGSLPSLGASSKSQFAVEGIVAAMGTGADAETLILSAASKSNAVTEQGTFSAGSLPSKAADTFSAGSLPSKAADTFNAGSAATLAKAKALTAANTGTAAAQTITVGTNDKVKVAKYDDLGVSVS